MRSPAEQTFASGDQYVQSISACRVGQAECAYSDACFGFDCSQCDSACACIEAERLQVWTRGGICTRDGSRASRFVSLQPIQHANAATDERNVRKRIRPCENVDRYAVAFEPFILTGHQSLSASH